MLWNLSTSNVFKEVFRLCFGVSLSLTPLPNKGPVLKDSVPVLNAVIIEAETSPNHLI